MPADIARFGVGQHDGVAHGCGAVFDRTGRHVVAGGMDWQHPQRAGYWKRNQAVIDEVYPLEDCLTEDPIQVMFNGPSSGCARSRRIWSQSAEEQRVSLHAD